MIRTTPNQPSERPTGERNEQSNVTGATTSGADRSKGYRLSATVVTAALANGAGAGAAKAAGTGAVGAGGVGAVTRDEPPPLPRLGAVDVLNPSWRRTARRSAFCTGFAR